MMLVAGSATADTVIHVAPNGNDAHPGSIDQPLASPPRAQQVVREAIAQGATGTLTVILHDGRYELREPLTFTPADAGNDHLKIIWQAADGEKPVLSGGRVITGWQHQGKNHWTVELPEVRQGQWHFRQLFADGQRKVRARYPNANEPLYIIKNIEELKDGEKITAHRLGFDRPLPGGTFADQDAEVVVLHFWSCARQLIATHEANTLTTRHPAGWIGHHFTCPHIGGRAYLEGARELLDQPGEWYLDTRSGTLHYLAVEGENPAEMQFVAPLAEQLVRIQGTRDNPVRNLHLKGLAFRDAAWSLPPFGYNGLQAATYGTIYKEEPTYMIPGAVYLEQAVGCSLIDCRIAHTGATGLALGAGCDKNLVTGCTIHDVGGNGIILGWQAKADGGSRKFFENGWADPADSPQTNRFTHNDIHQCGAVQLGSVGYVEMFSADSLVAHNHFHALPYSALSIGYIWNDTPTQQRNCTIEYNHIHDCMTLLHDGGGIYTLGAQPGTILRNNYIHDIPQGHGLYTDQGSSYIRLENNVVSRVGIYGYQHNGGHHNVLVNNIFYSSGKYAIMRFNGQDNPSFIIERNIIVCDRHAPNDHPWYQGRPGDKGEAFIDHADANDNYIMDNNIFWDPRDGQVLFTSRSFEQWQKQRGHDRHSIIADPKLADPENGNFSLAPDSPARRLAIQPIDLSRVGPQKKFP